MIFVEIYGKQILKSFGERFYSYCGELAVISYCLYQSLDANGRKLS
jgi:hypothetical protein